MTRPLRLLIDPGHGGDPGAVIDGVRECDINLQVGLALWYALDGLANHAVDERARWPLVAYMTRDRDTTLSIDGRVAIAKDVGADLVIHLHCDAAYRETKVTDLDTGEMHIERELDESRSGLHTLYWPGNNIGGETAAAIAAASLIAGEPGRVYEANSDWPRARLLMGAFPMDCVLVEMGYLTDPDDRAALQREAVQRSIVAACIAGVTRYLELRDE